MLSDPIFGKPARFNRLLNRYVASMTLTRQNIIDLVGTALDATPIQSFTIVNAVPGFVPIVLYATARLTLTGPSNYFFDTPPQLAIGWFTTSTLVANYNLDTLNGANRFTTLMPASTASEMVEFGASWPLIVYVYLATGDLAGGDPADRLVFTVHYTLEPFA